MVTVISKSELVKALSSLIVPTIITVALLLLGLYSPFLIFHFFAEFSSIFFALCLGIIIYFTFPITNNRYLQFLGLGYIVVAGLDVLHVITFPGMPFLMQNSTNVTLSFWVLTRLFEACLLLVSSRQFIYRLKVKTVVVFFFFIACSIFYIAAFDTLTLFIPDEGVTPLKSNIEWLVIVLLAFSFVINSKHQLTGKGKVYWEVQVAILLTLLAEVFFTWYIRVDNLSTIIGHLLKFLSFWFIFTAVVKRTLQNPIDLLQKDVSVYDAIPIPVVILDINGDVLQVNRSAEKLINHASKKIIGLNAHEFFHPQHLSAQQCPLCNALKKQQSVKNLVLTDKITVQSYRFSLTEILREGKLYGYIQVSQDITEELRSHERIAQQNSILNAVLNGTPDLVFYKDYLTAEGKYLGCNPAFEEFVGKTKKQIVGHTDIELFGDEVGTVFQSFDRDVLKSKRSTINNEWVNYPDGKKVLLSTSKSPLNLDSNILLGVLGISRDISQYMQLKSEVKEQKETLEYKTYYDQLTGLPNRTLFLDRLTQEIKLSQREDSALAVILIDIDHFKEINDSLGYHIGDLVIVEVASRLRNALRETDTVARLSGDEFSILLSGLHNTDYVVRIVNHLQQAMKHAMNIEQHQLYCTLSIGITLSPNDGNNALSLLQNADAAMHKAKNEGRNGYSFYKQEMTEKAFERVVMEGSLRHAIKNNEFIVFYQPQVEVTTNQLIGMEALIRWQHPDMGMVSPDKFIPLAEETGLIIELDQWTMHTAMKQLVGWYEEGLKPGVLALNLAMKQLQQKDFVKILCRMLSETMCRPEWIALEVTEGQIMMDPENSILMLQQLSDMGVGIAIDDFGTGYSSLSYLKRLPINKLKIDQSFVRGLPDDEDDAAITKAVIALAQNLHLSVIAEGVETAEQVKFLTDNGCYHIQGYYYGRPMPAEEMSCHIKSEYCK